MVFCYKSNSKGGPIFGGAGHLLVHLSFICQKIGHLTVSLRYLVVNKTYARIQKPLHETYFQ